MKKKPEQRKSPDEIFASIPHLPIGQIPDDMPVGQTMRAIIAKRGLLAAYEEADIVGQAIRDMLTDLRHLADYVGLEFYKLSDLAYDSYLEEYGEYVRAKAKPMPKDISNLKSPSKGARKQP